MHVLSMQLLKLVNEEMAGGVEAKVGGVPHEQGVGLSAWCLLRRLASSRGPLWTAQSPFCPWGGRRGVGFLDHILLMPPAGPSWDPCQSRGGKACQCFFLAPLTYR